MSLNAQQVCAQRTLASPGYCRRVSSVDSCADDDQIALLLIWIPAGIAVIPVILVSLLFVAPFYAAGKIAERVMGIARARSREAISG